MECGKPLYPGMTAQRRRPHWDHQMDCKRAVRLGTGDDDQFPWSGPPIDDILLVPKRMLSVLYMACLVSCLLQDMFNRAIISRRIKGVLRSTPTDTQCAYPMTSHGKSKLWQILWHPLLNTEGVIQGKSSRNALCGR